MPVCVSLRAHLSMRAGVNADLIKWSLSGAAGRLGDVWALKPVVLYVCGMELHVAHDSIVDVIHVSALNTEQKPWMQLAYDNK